MFHVGDQIEIADSGYVFLEDVIASFAIALAILYLKKLSLLMLRVCIA